MFVTKKLTKKFDCNMTENVDLYDLNYLKEYTRVCIRMYMFPGSERVNLQCPP